jgi:molybdopterin-guanine dinucleotide biosynthesis protein A
MTAGGFVLAGGRSSRMGRDKALLPVRGRTLLEHMAEQVRAAAGSVTIVADPARYARFEFPSVADERPGCGPLGGIVTALAVSTQPWNLIVACDMPDVDAAFLAGLLDQAFALRDPCDCLVPLGPSGPEPLCAVYQRGAMPKLRTALDRNILKMRAVLAVLETRLVAVADPRRFRNINTPEDWTDHG